MGRKKATDYLSGSSAENVTSRRKCNGSMSSFAQNHSCRILSSKQREKKLDNDKSHQSFHDRATTASNVDKDSRVTKADN